MKTSEDSFLLGLREVELAFAQKYTKDQVIVFRKHLDAIPARDWPGTVQQVIRTAKRLPSIADFFDARKALYTI